MSRAVAEDNSDSILDNGLFSLHRVTGDQRCERARWPDPLESTKVDRKTDSAPMGKDTRASVEEKRDAGEN